MSSRGRVITVSIYVCHTLSVDNVCNEMVTHCDKWLACSTAFPRLRGEHYISENQQGRRARRGWWERVLRFCISFQFTPFIPTFLNPLRPLVTNINFLLTISIHCQEIRLWLLIKWSPRVLCQKRETSLVSYWRLLRI